MPLHAIQYQLQWAFLCKASRNIKAPLFGQNPVMEIKYKE
jgi:hypothetical protein